MGIRRPGVSVGAHAGTHGTIGAFIGASAGVGAGAGTVASRHILSGDHTTIVTITAITMATAELSYTVQPESAPPTAFIHRIGLQRVP